MATHPADDLNARFAILDHIRFEESADGLTRILIKTPKAEAVIYTHGAHLAEWTPKGQHPGIYLSPRSPMNSGKAIRGGIPVIFPWFGARSDGKEGPMHGFARLSEWTVESTHFSPDNEVTIVLSLDPTDFARSLGYDQFHAAVQFHIGDHLNTTLEITNHGQQPLVFEDALHTYYAVGDAQQVTVEGLQGTTYLDKVTNFTRKTQTDKLLAFHSMVDQVHLSTAAPLTIHDPAWKRDIRIEKHGSNTTVTWNPWAESTAKSTELEPDAWKNFVCVEVANASENKLTLAPGATHRMDANVTIHPHA